jgi:hypothetical protein
VLRPSDLAGEQLTAALRPRGAFKRRLFLFLLFLVVLGAGQMAAYAVAGNDRPANNGGTTGQHGQDCPPSNHDTVGGTCEHNGGGGGNCGDNQGDGSACDDNGFGVRGDSCSQVSQTTPSTTTETDPTSTTTPTTTVTSCTHAHPCPNPGCTEAGHAPGDCVTTTTQETTTTTTTTTTAPSPPPPPPTATPTPSTTQSTTSSTTTTAPFTPPAIVCATRLSISSTQFVVGRRSILVVRVRDLNGTPVAGVTVLVRGAGVTLQAKTDSAGIARFSVRPRSAGMIRISLAQPAACNAVSRLARAVGIFKPPKPNFTGR